MIITIMTVAVLVEDLELKQINSYSIRLLYYTVKLLRLLFYGTATCSLNILIL